MILRRFQISINRKPSSSDTGLKSQWDSWLGRRDASQPVCPAQSVLTWCQCQPLSPVSETPGLNQTSFSHTQPPAGNWREIKTTTDTQTKHKIFILKLCAAKTQSSLLFSRRTFLFLINWTSCLSVEDQALTEVIIKQDKNQEAYEISHFSSRRVSFNLPLAVVTCREPIHCASLCA